MSADSEKPIHSYSPGVKPMAIAGRMVNERQRLAYGGMTKDEREWRRIWLSDQVLSAREPVYVSTFQKELMNPFRRFYRKPLDIVFHRVLQPLMTVENATIARFYTGRMFLGLWIILGTWYYFKYNTNTWERKGGWRVIESHEAVFPGEKGYPRSSFGKPNDYCDEGFKKSIFGQKIVKDQ